MRARLGAARRARCEWTPQRSSLSHDPLAAKFHVLFSKGAQRVSTPQIATRGGAAGGLLDECAERAPETGLFPSARRRRHSIPILCHRRYTSDGHDSVMNWRRRHRPSKLHTQLSKVSFQGGQGPMDSCRNPSQRLSDGRTALVEAPKSGRSL